VLEPLYEDGRVQKLPETHVDKITESLAGFTIADAEEAVSLVWAKHAAFPTWTRWPTRSRRRRPHYRQIAGLQYIPKEQVISRVLPGYESFTQWLTDG